MLAVASSGCGGDDATNAAEEAAGDVGAETIAEDVDAESLRSELDEIERTVRDDVARLSEARSLDDLSERLKRARSKLDESAEDLSEVDLSGDPDLEGARDDLASALRDFSAEVVDAEGAVGEGDLSRSLREVRQLTEERKRIDDTIAEVRRRLDERAGE